MTGSHVLDVAWLCPGCGQTVPRGQVAYQLDRLTWRCVACLVAVNASLPPAERTHCPRGHPYDQANTYHYPSGARACRACVRQAQRDRDRARDRKQSPPYNLAGLPGPARQTTRRTRHAKATNLEDLLDEWP